MLIPFVTRAGSAAALFLLMAAVGCASGPRVDQGILDFELPDLSGAEFAASHERFRDKVLLVTLWGTWCPPCVSEIPVFNDLQARYLADGLVIVAIAFDRNPDTLGRQMELREFVEQHDIGYFVLDGGTTDSFTDALPMVKGVKGLPVEILIDRDGRVVDCRNGYGFSEEWARGLEDRVTGLLYADR